MNSAETHRVEIQYLLMRDVAINPVSEMTIYENWYEGGMLNSKGVHGSGQSSRVGPDGVT